MLVSSSDDTMVLDRNFWTDGPAGAGEKKGANHEMFWLKSCPRCFGDLYEDTDKYGKFISCMQCGHYLSETEEARQKLRSIGWGTGSAALWWKERAAA